MGKELDFLHATRESGDVADAVGTPDEKDYEMLAHIISTYEKRRPGMIQATLKQGRRDYEAGVHHMKSVFSKNGDAVISEDTNLIYQMELPADLVQIIETEFPTLFRSKKHFAWFKEKFPVLLIKAR